MRRYTKSVRAALAALAMTFGMLPAVAQETAAPSGEKERPAAPRTPLVSVDARDDDIRETLVDIFRQAKIANYSIAPDVRGTVTLRLKDQPLETALNLLARTATPKLTWSRTDGIYEVRLRPARRVSEREDPLGPSEPPEAVVLDDGTRVEVIRLMYADARDIAVLLGALRPENLRAAIAYEPLNRLVTQWGGPAGAGGFVSGVIGGFPNQNRFDPGGMNPPQADPNLPRPGPPGQNPGSVPPPVPGE